MPSVVRNGAIIILLFHRTQASVLLVEAKCARSEGAELIRGPGVEPWRA
jgi:hypothetical protein